MGFKLSDSIHWWELHPELRSDVYQPNLRTSASNLLPGRGKLHWPKESALNILTFSLEPKDGLVNVRCTLRDKIVTKPMPKDSKLIRLSAAITDEGELADVEIVTTT